MKNKKPPVLRIESGIPAPPERGSYTGILVRMVVGDSILFPLRAKRSAISGVTQPSR